ncbi:MAG: hypothetical protein NWS85_11220, partial [Hydrogenophaga sp.]|nr:hypothetical protein [Hydrogenophaga sp.]
MTKLSQPVLASALFKTAHAGLDETLAQGWPQGHSLTLPGPQEPEDSDEDILPAGRQRLRAVFISDLHIGTPGF